MKRKAHRSTRRKETTRATVRELEPGSSAPTTSTSSSSAEPAATGPGPEAGIAPPSSAEEIARVVGEIRAAAPAPAAPGGEPAGRPGLEGDDAAEALLGRAERIVEGDLSELADVSADDIADIADLAFGLAADFRGPHWELEPKAGKRLGKWVKRMIDRHGWQWLAKWAPDIMAALLLLWEVGRRLRIDVHLAQEKKAATASQQPDAAA